MQQHAHRREGTTFCPTIEFCIKWFGYAKRGELLVWYIHVYKITHPEHIPCSIVQLIAVASYTTQHCLAQELQRNESHPNDKYCTTDCLRLANIRFTRMQVLLV